VCVTAVDQSLELLSDVFEAAGCEQNSTGAMTASAAARPGLTEGAQACAPRGKDRVPEPARTDQHDGIFTRTLVAFLIGALSELLVSYMTT
jgi:hypothetical protein